MIKLIDLNLVKLSEKEISVLKLLCEEKTAKEIGEELDISPRTIEAIKEKLMVKTGTRSSIGLALFAVKARLVEIE